MNRHIYDSLTSTNSFIRENPDMVSPMTMIIARCQTAGRGQRGNSWESEPGKNLTLSFYFKPSNIKPTEQFVISEAVALAVIDTLRDHEIEAKVKWPNDIYVGDKKICGILIECSILGNRLDRCICGIGLNVNQTMFLSPAPNPVSMSLLTGKEFNLDSLADILGSHLEDRINSLSDTNVSAEDLKEIHEEYFNNLYWNDGEFHRFILPDSSPLLPSLDSNQIPEDSKKNYFSGRIRSITPSGEILIENTREEITPFFFKEIAFDIRSH